jgi:hypothetical protein
VVAGGPQSLAFWDVASVRVKKSREGKEAQSAAAIKTAGDEDDEQGQETLNGAADDDSDSVLFEVEGKNSMADEEPYMNLVQWLVVDEAGVGLKGAKITIGTRTGDASVIVAHLTTDKNGLATIRLPWSA